MNRKKVIGYVGRNDLDIVTQKDIKALDVINIAFANIKNDVVTYEESGKEEHLKTIKEINPNCKIVLSIGGWGSGGFSEAASTDEGRKKVANSALELVKKYNLDGIDLDWEYPCIGIAGIGASPDDKENFTLLLKEIRQTLDTYNKDLLLTIAAGGDSYYTRCTNMKEAQKYLDYVQLMTYDLRGGFTVATGHHTSLYSNRADLSPVCADFAVKCFKEAGVPEEKLILGVAFYSRMWKQVPKDNNGLMQMAGTTGGYGPDFSQLKKEYIDKNGFVRYWDDEAKAPYLFNGDTFISYDDEESIKAKAEYVNKNNLGGLMYWEYCLDKDFTLTGVLRDELDKD